MSGIPANEKAAVIIVVVLGIIGGVVLGLVGWGAWELFKFLVRLAIQ